MSKGMTMYKLAGFDFSNRLGVVVSELAPEEMDHQDATPKATRSDPASASPAAGDLERAVFGAA